MLHLHKAIYISICSLPVVFAVPKKKKKVAVFVYKTPPPPIKPFKQTQVIFLEMTMAEMLEGKSFYGSGQQRNSWKFSEETLETGGMRRMGPASGLVFFYTQT